MRHCERSEAIQTFARGQMDCFVASAPRNDEELLYFGSYVSSQALGTRSEILMATSRVAASRTMRPSMLPRMNQTEKNA